MTATTTMDKPTTATDASEQLPLNSALDGHAEEAKRLIYRSTNHLSASRTSNDVFYVDGDESIGTADGHAGCREVERIKNGDYCNGKERDYSDSSTVRKRIQAMSEGKGRELMRRKSHHSEVEVIPEDEGDNGSFFAKVSLKIKWMMRIGFPSLLFICY